MKEGFSVEQITRVLQQVGGGMPVGEVCRQVGISEKRYQSRREFTVDSGSPTGGKWRPKHDLQQPQHVG